MKTMRTGRSLAFAVVAAMALAAGPAAAQVGFYLTSPGIELTESDREQIRTTIGSALNEAEIDEVRAWQNDETGVGGDVRIFDRSTLDDTQCAEALITLRSETRRRSFDLLFCQRPDGTWGIAG